MLRRLPSAESPITVPQSALVCVSTRIAFGAGKGTLTGAAGAASKRSMTRQPMLWNVGSGYPIGKATVENGKDAPERTRARLVSWLPACRLKSTAALTYFAD